MKEQKRESQWAWKSDSRCSNRRGSPDEASRRHVLRRCGAIVVGRGFGTENFSDFLVQLVWIRTSWELCFRTNFPYRLVNPLRLHHTQQRTTSLYLSSYSRFSQLEHIRINRCVEIYTKFTCTVGACKLYAVDLYYFLRPLAQGLQAKILYISK